MSFWNGHRWEADTPPPEVKPATKSRARRIGATALEATLVTALTFGLIAGSTFAAKGGRSGGGGGGGHHSGGGSPTGGLVLVMVADANGDGAPNWNDTITFTVTSSVSSPYVSVRCTQNGAVVYAADAGFYSDYPWPGAQNMPLESPSWTGGAAACSATLNGSLALTFSAAA